MISMSIMFATFARVFLLGFQSRFVNARLWGSAWVTSWMIAGAIARLGQMERAWIEDFKGCNRHADADTSCLQHNIGNHKDRRDS